MFDNAQPQLYQRNLALIQEIYPNYLSLLSQTQGTSPYKIDIKNSKTIHCKLDDQWIHGPGDPWELAEKTILDTKWTEQSMFLIIRPGLGYLPFSLYPNLRKGRNAQRMLIVEDRIDLFQASLQWFDWTDVLRSDRTILLLAENPINAVVDFFVMNPIAILIPFTGMCGAVVGDMEKRIMDRLGAVLNDMSQKVFGASKEYLGDLARFYEESKTNPGRQKRVLMVEPEHDYLADSIKEAFASENWWVNTYKANERLLRFLNPYIWLVYTRENYPDLLLWMNRNSLSPEGVHHLKNFPIQKVLWFLDSPKRVETTKEELDATDFYFSFDPTYLPFLRELSGKEGYYLPTGAGIKPLLDCQPGQIWPERHGPATGFMGALAAQRFQSVREFWLRRDMLFVQILDTIVEEFLSDPSIPLEDRYNNSSGRNRLPYSGFVVLYLEERTTYLTRLRYLQHLRDLGLITYGGVEWANPDWAEDLVPCFSGETPRYREDLPRVYYNTKININIFHAQCINSANPRVYDVLAAGGFLLTEYKPVLEEEFTLDHHLVCFHSPEELREKTEYYLAHEEEREAIARAGQQFVLENATYQHRIKSMLEIIASR